MREIRFRAWDTRTNYWVEAVRLVIHASGNILNTEGIILMQYTGVKDKNGKEIWEGDVVYSEWAGRPKRSVVKWGQMDNDRMVNGIGFILYDQPESVEVLGNIWETPELLMVKSDEEEI